MMINYSLENAPLQKELYAGKSLTMLLILIVVLMEVVCGSIVSEYLNL